MAPQQRDLHFEATTSTAMMHDASHYSVVPVLSQNNSQSHKETGHSCDACSFCADICGDDHCATCQSDNLFRNKKSNNNNSFLEHRPTLPFFGCDKEKYYTLCQVRRHCTAESAWLLVGDTIYDATTYIAKHPGGTRSILKKSGGRVDCTVDFEFHSKKARNMWKSYKVGKLRPCESQGLKKEEQCTIS
mmetsp:Transcript_20249/g.29273  ORF Transcript_20249/g.29273 Transcript_20249/m.29273 type:complete len:189 (-) Transcript_20249:215-781(-)